MHARPHISDSGSCDLSITDLSLEMSFFVDGRSVHLCMRKRAQKTNRLAQETIGECVFNWCSYTKILFYQRS